VIIAKKTLEGHPLDFQAKRTLGMSFKNSSQKITSKKK